MSDIWKYKIVIRFSDENPVLTGRPDYIVSMRLKQIPIISVRGTSSELIQKEIFSYLTKQIRFMATEILFIFKLGRLSYYIA